MRGNKIKRQDMVKMTKQEKAILNRIKHENMHKRKKVRKECNSQAQ